MPATTRDSAGLHYEVEGEGPTIVLQHPLTADGRAWRGIRLVEDLVAAGFRCVTPDALGHGRSDPSAPDRVGLGARVADLLAVADEVGAETFHYVGYSMGGWIGVGLVQAAPRRLKSLCIAGWDPIDGARHFTPLKSMPERREAFRDTIRDLNARTPSRAAPDAVREDGFVDTYERLFRDLPSIATLIGLDAPMMLAVGEDDPYAPSVEAAAEALAVEFLRLPGDHVGAFLGPEFRRGVVDWLTRARAA